MLYRNFKRHQLKAKKGYGPVSSSIPWTRKAADTLPLELASTSLEFTIRSLLLTPGFPDADADSSLNWSISELWVIVILRRRSFSFAIFFRSLLVSSNTVILMRAVPAAKFPVKALREASYPRCWVSDCWRAAFSSSIRLWTPDKLSCMRVSLRILRAVLSSRLFARFWRWNKVVWLFFMIPVFSEDSTSSYTCSSTRRALKERNQL